METITDPTDPRLADYRHLTDAAARRSVEGDDAHGIFIVEGVLAVQQLLASGRPVRSAVFTPPRATALRELVLDLQRAGAAVMIAERPVLAGVTGFDVHRGLLASAARTAPLSMAEVVHGARRIAVLEELNDHENLGSVFRNAAALGLDAVLLDERSADPLYRRSIRVSLGWALRVPHTRVQSLPESLALLRSDGWSTVALTPGATSIPVDLAAASGVLDDRLALVIGAEGPGLCEQTMASCETRVRIPMQSGVDSLNVATALAVVASFAAARRGWADRGPSFVEDHPIG